MTSASKSSDENPSSAANDAVTKVDCPTCGKSVPWIAESKFRPFCSERCRLIDLGEWASESHRIPGNDDDLMSGDLPPEY